NGHLLTDLARPLAAAGLHGVNVSLDTLDPARFSEVTSRGDLARVIAGIDGARDAGLEVKLNAVALAGVNEGEIADLAAFAWQRAITIRYIEHMPLSDGMLYHPERELSAAAIRTAIAERFGPLEPSPRQRTNVGPARYWCLAGQPAREFG